MTAHQSLGEEISNIAHRAAQQYLIAHALEADAEVLDLAIARHCVERLPRAISEAGRSLRCGMPDVARVKLRAYMMRAGRAAAKEVGV